LNISRIYKGPWEPAAWVWHRAPKGVRIVRGVQRCARLRVYGNRDGRDIIHSRIWHTRWHAREEVEVHFWDRGHSPGGLVHGRVRAVECRERWRWY
jgi:hypothetical protein